MPRYRLVLEFDGGPFVGWQRQENGPSVQAAVERAIGAMLNETVTVFAAGRTDAGVHALAMPVHFDLDRDVAPEKLMAGINHHLRPDPVAVLDARRTDDDFHARFSAVSRSYVYRILNRRPTPAIERGRVWHVARRLSTERMQEASQALLGKHDFTSFRSSECQASSPVKMLNRVHVERFGDEIHFKLEAPSFLHHQVRNIVGSLKLIGEGSRPVSFIDDALKARDRSQAGPTAPAQGLYFVRADYPASNW
ncbi:MAG: tRNA pseudouridine(38-40) synthase TruA [Geminicoccaceae bacterium]|nr:tRNA pseudouridine(38-40) synthase TruA [Geminicoccaceae bacterium]